MTITVSTKGQIVLPAEIRQQDGIEPGQEFEIERIDRGEYRLVRRQGRPNAGVVDWLWSCQRLLRSHRIGIHGHAVKSLVDPFA